MALSPSPLSPPSPAPVPSHPRATATPLPPRGHGKAGDSAVAKTAEQFEAVFLGQMTQLMMESVETDDTFSGGHGEEMFRGVLAEKLGTEIARTGGIGLAPAVMEQIIKMQGESGNGH